MAKNKIVFNKKTKQLLTWIKSNKLEIISLLIILIIGGYFRMYRISEYMTFLGDEGRDVIVVRRLLTDLDPILVGPGTSIGNMYLGPLYYYMMAPALLLAGFSPAGPAIMVALLGIVTIGFVWWIGRLWFGKIAGLIASVLYAIIPTIIIYSRSSWNPNIMPFFSLLCIYGIWKFWTEKKYKWLIATSVSFAFVLQSHYLGLLLGPVIAFFAFLALLGARKKSEKRDYLKNLATSIVIFILLMSPLVIFDARHGWNNFQSMKKFFTVRQTTISARPWTALPKLPKIIDKVSVRVLTGYNQALTKWLLPTIAIIAAYVFVSFKKMNKKHLNAYFLIFVWLAIAFIGLGVYKQEIYDHYYGFFYAAPLLLIGGLLDNLIRKNKLLSIAAVVLLLPIIRSNLDSNPLNYDPNRQLQRTESVVRKIEELSENNAFNFAVLAERNYEGAYMYFFEMWDIEAEIAIADKLDETLKDQLFVVCELPREKCLPEASDRPEITNFGWLEKVADWEHQGIIILKYIHPEPST